MYNFTGRFECKVDAKGRIVLPSGLLKQFPESQRRQFVVNVGLYKPCLELYSLEAWNQFMDRIRSLNQHDPEVEVFIDMVLGDASTLDLDTANRINIPKSLATKASLNTDAILMPGLNTYKIWSPEVYEQEMGSHSRNLRSELARKFLSDGGSGTSAPGT
jgi:MraZ protein